ncbi:MAG TPA: phosphoglycerate mutase [Ramlibacter sp.]|jgi:hypothetical protein|uniref:phosphoglycerate mutase n=1 Tax=Ramlibacter sp. TaxID=1917967 RepID=UPI002D67155F|nr:phosphoglycerate mutase [Ramlibacter sp.]HZY20152.1 phosphoglycerate mutase [Ramlibacter sp.]
MSDGDHLLIPFAASGAEGCRSVLERLSLPHLERLLARLAPGETDAGDDRLLSMPHERALARACGIRGSDGQLPWAAWQVAQSDRDPGQDAWSWITPCHWRVGADHVFMQHPQELHLDAQESQALLAAMQPYFEQDGITLSYDAPTRWLARGPLFAGLATASLDRVVGRVIDPWMPRGDAARPLRRLQQEMQMLLYTHPVNEERTRGGLLPVNSFWASGTGALAEGDRPATPAGLRITHSLRDAALLQDWRAWGAAWQQLDARDAARLQQALETGRPVALTLCGERQARTWRSAGAGWRQRLAGLVSRRRPIDWLNEL